MQSFVTIEYHCKATRRMQLPAWVKVQKVDFTAKDPVRESRDLKVRAVQCSNRPRPGQSPYSKPHCFSYFRQ